MVFMPIYLYKGWSKDPGPTIWCGCPTPFFAIGNHMKELSIFIDESGDFGEYNKISPYYIVTMVFHDQDKDIKKWKKLMSN